MKTVTASMSRWDGATCPDGVVAAMGEDCTNHRGLSRMNVEGFVERVEVELRGSSRCWFPETSKALSRVEGTTSNGYFYLLGRSWVHLATGALVSRTATLQYDAQSRRFTLENDCGRAVYALVDAATR